MACCDRSTNSRIERDASGHPTALIAPDGQRTTLTLDGNGYLASVANPAGEATRMTYTADGLLTRFSDGNGHASVMQYDAMGRLLNNTNAAGGGWTLARSEFQNGYTASLASALGRTTSYRVEHLGTGDRVRSTTGPDGTVTTALKKTDGSTLTTAADGTVTTEVLGPDPRFGMQAPITRSLTLRTPSGLTSTLTASRTASLANANDPFSLSSLTDSVTVNGRVSIQTYTAATRTLSRTSPAGRTTVSTLDAQGRPIRQQIPGLAEVSYAYDPRGRLIQVTQGTGAETRASSLHYDERGNVDATTDALSRTHRFAHDGAGRPIEATTSDQRVMQFSYDKNGNLSALTPPTRPAHGFAYTPVDLASEYAPPSVAGVSAAATHYAYNLDQQATTINRPDGQSISFRYDVGGRLDQLASGVGTPAQTSVQTSFAYLPVTGQLSQIGTGQGVTLAYRYDGSLPVSEAWSGPVTGTVARAYDPDLRVNSLAVNGTAMAFGYDADSLLTSAGALGLTRDAQNGLLTGTVLGGLTTTLAYTGFGEVSQSSASHNGAAVISTGFSYDAGARITRKVETLGSQTDIYAYAYDPAGRLAEVRKNGVLQASYQYDPNGNRLARTGASGTTQGTYDAQDRLLSYGANTYTYTDNGELASKTVGAQTTAYNYDVLGNLRQVALPGGTAIEYVIDGQNRRVGKTINGVRVQGFLYQDQLKPIAELDGAGTVVSRFVYATGINVPDYLIKGTTTYRIITDQLGSPRLVVNTATGAIAQRLDFDEFGNVTLDTAPGFQPFGFAGGIYDRDTRLVRFGARDYDPEVGRWTAKDPIRFAGGDSNLFAYVGGNPVNNIDPLGLTTLHFSCSSNTLTVDPQVKGRKPYNVRATSGINGGESCKDRSTKNSGAIPKGSYSIKSNDVSNPGLLGDIARNMRGDWGDWRVTMSPAPSTETFGRSGFFLHGGSTPGSAGCIDIGGGLFGDHLTDQVLNDILNDPDGVIPVTVD